MFFTFYVCMYVSEAVVEGTFLRDNVQSASNYHKISRMALVSSQRGLFCDDNLLTLHYPSNYTATYQKINKEIWNIDLNSFDYVSLLWETSTL